MSEMKLFRDRDEVSKVAKLHGASLIVGWSQFYRKKRLDVRRRSAHARSPDIKKDRRVKAFAGFVEIRRTAPVRGHK
jgi:hypothetical protein